MIELQGFLIPRLWQFARFYTVRPDSEGIQQFDEELDWEVSEASLTNVAMWHLNYQLKWFFFLNIHSNFVFIVYRID